MLLAIDWSALMANIGQFILAFSILVVLHEMGHFFPAKWFGCRVEKFYLFFNPWFSLWKKRVGETEYGLGWVPLGGYVKISGMVDESMDKEQMKLPPQPYEFRSKPAWQRLIIMIGGVVVNFLLAFIIFAMVLFVWGEERLPTANMRYGIATDSLAKSVGLRDGDRITAVNGAPLKYYNDLLKTIAFSEKTTISLQRDGRDTSITLPPGFLSKLSKSERSAFVSPRMPFVIKTVDDVKHLSGELQPGDRIVGVNGTPTPLYDDFVRLRPQLKDKEVTLAVSRANAPAEVRVKIKENGTIGVLPQDAYTVLGSEKRDYGFFESIPAGARMGVERLNDYVTGIGLLFTSKEHKVSDNLGSVVSIGKTFGGIWNWQHFWTMTALFSVILAFMNILPIPALDGGHALFTLYEMITGRKPSDKFMEYAQMVGMVLLLGLMLYAFGLDIWRLFR